MNNKITLWLDNFGSVAAWTCAVHCLAIPFLLAFLPFAGLSFLVEESTEKVFLGVSAIVAVLSLLPAYFRRHGKLRSILLAVSGIGLIILTHLYFEENFVLKIAFLVSGACLLTAAHLVNRRLCRNCPVC